MAYDSLDRTLKLSVSVYISGMWYEVPGSQIIRATISQLTSSKSVLSMGEFCRNKLELTYRVGDLLYPSDTTFPSDSTFPTLNIAWSNKKVKLSISESDSAAVAVGTFYVSGSEISTKDAGKTYTIIGYDTPNSMNDVFPVASSSTKVSAILNSIESHTGMSFADKNFSLTEITEVPTNTTYGGLLGYIAGYDGKNIRINAEGKIEAYWYDTTKTFTITRAVQLQGEFTDKQTVPGINAIVSGSGNGNTISVGSGSAVEYVNPYVTEDVLSAILTRVKGFTYNYGTVKWRGNPEVRAGDTVSIETSEGVTALFPIVENTITFDGGMTFNSVGHTYVQETTVLGSSSPTERKLEIVYHKLDNALKQATDLMKGGEGGYYKLLTDEAGKPYGYQIADSDPVDTTTNGWIFTNNGLFHSSDGFQTVSKVAITMNGHIVGDYIDTGIISDGDGTSGANWWNLDTGEIHIGNSNVVTKDDGAIASVITYWLQTSSSGIPDKSDDGWTENPSVFKSGNHVWRMTKTTYINPTQSPTYSDPVEITSPEIVNVTNYYRLSASKDKLHDWLYPSDNTFPGDDTFPSDQWTAEWYTEYPKWSPDEYLWTVTLLTYTDGTKKWTDPIVNTEYTNVTSLITTYDTKFEETDQVISLKADSSTVNTYYSDVLGQITQEKTDRSAEIKETADSINAKVTSVSNDTVRDMKTYYKTSVSDTDVNADGYLYPSESTLPSDETYPTLPIDSDKSWIDHQPSPTAGHYLWTKYVLTYYDESTQKNITKEFIRLEELESSAYNRTVNNSAAVNVLNNSVELNASQISELNGEVSNQSAKFSVAYNEINSKVSDVSEQISQEKIDRSAEIKQTADSINSEVSKKVGEDEIISKINQSAESVAIKANKIKLEGLVTANKGFSIDENGNMTANNGTFSGTIDGSEINGSNINGSKFISKSNDKNHALEINYLTIQEVNTQTTEENPTNEDSGQILFSNGVSVQAGMESDPTMESEVGVYPNSVLISSGLGAYPISDFTVSRDAIVLQHNDKKLFYMNTNDNNSLFVSDGGGDFGRPVTVTGIKDGDGLHAINVGWDGSYLSFFVDNTNVTSHISDMRAKKDISPISDSIVNAIGSVNIKQFRMRDKPFNTALVHYGVLAQSVIKAFKDSGVDPADQFVIGKEPKNNKIDSENYYTVNKEEFLMARIAYDEKIIKSLEERITELENIVKEKQK